MDALIERLVPSVERETWRGASDEEIEHLKEISEATLPAFYRWFLHTMGAAFPHPEYGYERQDLRIGTVIEAYEQCLVEPDPRYLLIGRTPNPAMPGFIMYDCEAPCRDDALVVSCSEDGPPMAPDFETFREQLAWGMLRKYRVTRCAQRCSGVIRDTDGEIFSHLDAVMERLGFTSPVATGAFCGLYEREDAALASMSVVEDRYRGIQVFRMGGPDMGALRRILGEVASASSVEVEIKRWQPPLP